MKLAQELRETAQKIQAKKAKATKPVVNKAAKLKEQTIVWTYNKAVKLAKAAAAKGKQSCWFWIYKDLRYKDQIYEEACTETIKKLKKDGLQAEMRFDAKSIKCMEQGYGCYQMPSYWLKLEVSWY